MLHFWPSVSHIIKAVIKALSKLQLHTESVPQRNPDMTSDTWSYNVAIKNSLSSFLNLQIQLIIICRFITKKSLFHIVSVINIIM